MPFFDFPLEQLKTYCPPLQEPADFDQFWAKTLAETREHPLNARFEPVDIGLSLLDTFDVTFNGYGGHPIKGWLVLPRGVQTPIPCVVEYIGYGGGRGHLLDWLMWSNFGYAHFIMDTRGQGSAWRPGDTPDPADGEPQYPGFMTRGVMNPETYYYRRVFSDAVRAIEAARSHPAVDSSRVALSGGSQGGGITLAAAALDPTVAAALPDVPFLCHYRAAVELIDTHPYVEITNYLKTHREKVDTVFNTLSYFDGVHFSARAKSPAQFSVALMDTVCPPRTVYAAYNHYAGEKEMLVWQFNNHEGGGTYQTTEKVRFLRHLWG